MVSNCCENYRCVSKIASPEARNKKNKNLLWTASLCTSNRLAAKLKLPSQMHMHTHTHTKTQAHRHRHIQRLEMLIARDHKTHTEEHVSKCKESEMHENETRVKSTSKSTIVNSLDHWVFNVEWFYRQRENCRWLFLKWNNVRSHVACACTWLWLCYM